MDQKRNKDGVVIYTFDMYIYKTHSLQSGMDQRREKEGVVIHSHLYIWHVHIHNSQTKLAMDKRR